MKATGHPDPVKTPKVTQSKPPFYGELAPADDWAIFFDLPDLAEHSVKEFPQEICKTGKCIDAFIVSRQKKICLLGPELTVPIEERLEIWHREKSEKYNKMILESSEPEWKTKPFVIEVGCRGYLPPSFRQAMHALGFSNKEIQKLIDDCSLVARRSSYYIWLNRFSKQFVDFKMVDINIESYKAVAL